MNGIEAASPDNRLVLQLMALILEMTEDERLDLLMKLEAQPGRDLGLGERSDARKPYAKPVRLSVRDRTYTALCKDISNGGIFIETDQVFQVGQIVTLIIPFSDDRRNLNVPAEIVRVSQDGIGLRFLKKQQPPERQ